MKLCERGGLDTPEKFHIIKRHFSAETKECSLPKQDPRVLQATTPSSNRKVKEEWSSSWNPDFYFPHANSERMN